MECDSAIKKKEVGFPGGVVVKNLPVNAGDMGLTPGAERSYMLRIIAVGTLESRELGTLGRSQKQRCVSATLWYPSLGAGLAPLT